MKHTLCLLMTLLVCACAPAWEKPGATAGDFDAAQDQCTKTAEEKYPPVLHQVMTRGAYSTSNKTACFGSPNLADCLNTQDIFVPPTFVTVDDNKKPRAQFVDRCLRQQGWRPVNND